MLALGRHEGRLDGNSRIVLDDVAYQPENPLAVFLGNELETAHLRYLLVGVADRPRELLVPPEHPPAGVEGVDGIRYRIEDALGDCTLFAELALAVCRDIPEQAVDQRAAIGTDGASADFDRDEFAICGPHPHRRAVVKPGDVRRFGTNVPSEQFAVVLGFPFWIQLSVGHSENLLT